MQQCTHCQADLPANAQFCNRCGTPAEERQTPSADPEEADISNEELEETTKHPAIAVSALHARNAPATSSVSAPSLPAEEKRATGTADAPIVAGDAHLASTEAQLPLTPSTEDEPAESQEPHISTEADLPAQASAESASPPQAPAESDPPAHTSLTQPEDASQLAIEALDTVALPAMPAAVLSATPPTVETSISATPSTDAQESTPSTLADAQTDASAATPETATALAADSATVDPATESSPEPSASEKESAPQEEAAQAQTTRTPAAPLPPPISRKGARTGRSTVLVTLLIIAVVILAGGVGTFVLLSQRAATGASPQCNSPQVTCVNGTPINLNGQATNLTFSGAVAGPMSIVAKARCQIAAVGNLRTLTINLSGTINDQLYNFGFAIERYNGPGTYSNATTTIAILFDTPGESTTNGWNNSATTDTGTITVARGEQNGSISYTLSGIGKQARTQIQASGNWTCNN